MKHQIGARSLAITIALAASVATLHAKPPAIPAIAPNSPLLKIDPEEIACGRPAIALMDATRITTGWDHRRFPGSR